MSRYSYGRFPKYVSVAKKRAKTEKKIKQLKKKNPDISPVSIEGKKLAESWWGISWNKNLESYADFSNRIGRGRSYVRHSAVLDLQIKPGKIESLVNGSFSTPYSVEIKIKKIKTLKWKNIIKKCQGETDSLNDLLDGKLPESMANILTNQKQGIFPSPDEIEFDCSCPDWAYMCKHVAATLYGVGTRLDHDPAMFFSLRGIKMDDLVSEAIQAQASQLIEKSKTKKSKRIIQNADLSSQFGIDFDGSDLPGSKLKSTSKPKSKIKPKSKSKSKSKPQLKSVPVRRTTQEIRLLEAAARKMGASTVRRTTQQEIRSIRKTRQKQHITPYKIVTRIITRRTKNPIGFKEIKERTGLEDAVIRNNIQRAKIKGLITNQGRGLYIKK